jgi:acyl-CoA hydrolase
MSMPETGNKHARQFAGRIFALMDMLIASKHAGGTFCLKSIEIEMTRQLNYSV